MIGVYVLGMAYDSLSDKDKKAFDGLVDKMRLNSSEYSSYVYTKDGEYRRTSMFSNMPNSSCPVSSEKVSIQALVDFEKRLEIISDKKDLDRLRRLEAKLKETKSLLDNI